MRWFRKNKKEVTIKIQLTPQEKALKVQVLKGAEEEELPIRLSPTDYKFVDDLDLLQLIDDLWYEELVYTEDNKYFISYSTIYKLGEVDRGILNLPPKESSLKIELDNQSFVGSPDFKLITKYHYGEFKNLQRFIKRNGPFIELPNKETILLSQDQFEFLEEIDKQPSEKNTEEYFQYIAKIKNHAKKLNIKISEHLQRENYDFVEDFDLEVERNKDAILLKPTLRHDDLSDDTLKAFSKNKSGYMKGNGKRIFLDSHTKQQVDRINKIPVISGIDIPRFVENPEAFIPEDLGISLELFGERVRNLGIRVYHAQPFIHANKNDRGWFEFETGYNVRDEEGEVVSRVPEHYFEDSETEVIQLSDDEYVFPSGSTEDFSNTVNQLKQYTKNNKIKDLTKVSFVLEIFENLDYIEFNQPIQEIKDSLLDQKVFDEVPPSLFSAKLKPFQVEGFVWMKSLRFSGYGGLLADDMGLGKTVQVIAYLSYLKEQGKLSPTLLVLPKSLTDNWVNEMKKFAPTLIDKLYWHQGPDRLKEKILIEQNEIIITTYQTLVRDQLILGQVNWQTIICDEAQAIKNPTTSVSKVVKALKNKGRIALTGTPVENTLTELWSIVDFVQPGLLSSLKEFKEQYLKPLERNELHYDEVQKKLDKKIKFIYKRRTKAEELKGQLPNKYFEPIKCDISTDQNKYYSVIIKEIQEKNIKPIEGIMKLKMLLSHPGLIDASLRNLSSKSVPKLQKTLDLVNGIKVKDEKVLIFTEYREMQNILKKHIIDSFGIIPPIVNGMTDRRQQVVDDFNISVGFNVMILSPKAAGTGLTITSANHVIHYTRWWNPAVENQATDRVYRIGQEKDVTVYYPIVTAEQLSLGKTVEEIVDQLLQEKQQLSSNIIVPSEDLDIEKVLLETLKLH